jgi:glycosyltransferase involved in cell wall biosynthesis
VSVAYVPYAPTAASVEAGWLAESLRCPVAVVECRQTLNLAEHEDLPDPGALRSALEPVFAHEWVVAEGIGGFLWAAVARADGFGGAFTILPYLNPSSWFDLTALAAYRKSAAPRDRVFVGSTPSARLYRDLGVEAIVGEPFGVDCDVFRPRSPGAALAELGIDANGPVLLFAGRLEPDKDVHRLLGVALKARLLFPELQVVIAAHRVDRGYLSLFERLLAPERGVHLVVDPDRDRLARLYCAASVFVTASTSHFETFGRAPAEALACGTPAVAPRYDGFAEVLAQPGGTVVDVALEEGVPRASEASLLRAIYAALALPAAATRDEIASAARRRFCRSRTLGVLGYLADPTREAPSPAVGICGLDVAIPDGWGVAATRMAAMSPRDALKHLWDGRAHRTLSGGNEAFRVAVRRALAGAALVPTESTGASQPCP